MEDMNFYFYVKLFLASIVFVLVPLILLARQKRYSSNPNPHPPPGPWKLPVIGNLHQLAFSSDLPHHRLRYLARQYGNLMHLQLGELSNVVVSSAEVAREMMRTHDANFSQRPFLIAASLYEFKNIAFAPYGEYWRQLRKICVQELLSPARVRSFRLIREEEVSALVKRLYFASSSAVNLSEMIFSMTFGITAQAAFGKKCRDMEAFITAVTDSMELVGGLSVAELFPSQAWLQWVTGFRPKLEKHFKCVDGILHDIIESRRADREISGAEELIRDKSLLDTLLGIQEKAELPFALETQNIKAVILDVFVAGSDTSATAVEWAMFELLRNPAVMEKAQAETRRVFGEERKIDETRIHELNYLSFVIKETLRLHPPAPLLAPRESRENCVLNGYDVPAQTKVIVNAWAIGRDPRYWKDPETFNPERFVDSGVDFWGRDFEIIPFGAGRRMCPGVSFAMAGIELPLASLLFHFDWRIPNERAFDDTDAIERFGLTVRLKDELYLIPVPHATTCI